ncbi:MAG: NUDIX hydrolase [bacterium]
MSDHNHLTVATVIEDNGRYLMVREVDKFSGRLVYNQPAGHVDEGESLIDAAIRETLEETRWDVRLTGIIGFYTYSAPNGITYYRVCFSAEPIRENPNSPLCPDIDAALWMPAADVRHLQNELRSPLVLRAIEDFEQGILHPLELIKPPYRQR